MLASQNCSLRLLHDCFGASRIAYGDHWNRYNHYENKVFRTLEYWSWLTVALREKWCILFVLMKAHLVVTGKLCIWPKTTIEQWYLLGMNPQQEQEITRRAQILFLGSALSAQAAVDWEKPRDQLAADGSVTTVNIKVRQPVMVQRYYECCGIIDMATVKVLSSWRRSGGLIHGSSEFFSLSWELFW